MRIEEDDVKNLGLYFEGKEQGKISQNKVRLFVKPHPVYPLKKKIGSLI